LTRHTVAHREAKCTRPCLHHRGCRSFLPFFHPTDSRNGRVAGSFDGKAVFAAVHRTRCAPFSEQKMKSSAALFALATGAFAIGTTEFSPMGLLPVIADGVQVSIPTAGMLVSAYAVGVMVGAPIMTLLLSRFGKRSALMFLMLIFTVGNLLSATAPGYTTLLLSRLVTSLNHGAFFGIGAVVAASVVPREKQASAIAAMFMGLTLANIGGVPAATWIGQQVGWR